MKIAIITHHWVPNFGANLQALASFNTLRQHFDVQMLNYIPSGLMDAYKRICSEEQIQTHIDFTQEFMTLSPVLETAEALKEYCYEQKFDVIASGSDAIFRLFKDGSNNEGPFPNPFWLHWATQWDDYKPRTGFVSGSATGSNYVTFPGKTKRMIFETLADIDYISVRDLWTKKMFHHISGGKLDVKRSPDPVTNLNNVTTFPEKYRAAAEAEKGKYVLYSARPGRVPDSWLKEFVNLCHDKGLKVYGLPMPEYEMSYPFDKNIPLPISPAEWYSWIQNSAGIVGERFHLLVSSMVNSVPFYSIDHYRKRGIKGYFKFINFPLSSKVYSVAKDAGLEKNVVHFPDFPKKKPQFVLDSLESFDIAQAQKIYSRISEKFSHKL